MEGDGPTWQIKSIQWDGQYTDWCNSEHGQVETYTDGETTDYYCRRPDGTYIE